MPKATENRTRFIAHGGFSAKFPENTRQSYLEAAKHHPFAIEMDIVRHPQTGELICYHPHGESSGQGTYEPEAIAQQLEAGAPYEKLSEMLHILGDQQKYLLDLKQPSQQTFERLLKDPNINHQLIIVGVRNMSDVEIIQGIAPDVKLLALFSDPDSYAEFAQAGGKYFRLWEKDVTKERVAEIQRVGLEAWVTPGAKAKPGQPRTAGEVTEEKLNRLVGFVDGILVNDIELAKSFRLKGKTCL